MTFNAGIEAAARKRADEPIGHLARTVGGGLTYVSNEDAKFYSTAFPVYTRPSSSAPVEQREAVARIIDPQAFKMWHDLYHHCIKNGDDEAFAKRCADSSHKPDCDAALTKADAILSLPGSSRDEVLASVNAALFKPDESDAIDNLEGALTDIKRLSEAGKPTDAVCIRTLERIQVQLVNAHRALKSGGTK